ncbi:5-(carboxyamino)imidazole ribonucleotide synthase [Sphingomonas canadensis]|uniref:N5-carboxyaminoimidazole ribonucleotide synthase n=1 Tax=Sphingomonas canadensis TaxID=1219257 RepID=A0ABW3H9Z9_9SPHN|nr:5-(carboxyamino)imidazole ribonucleotide synthase [Sphingomonas canadensis]MCW3837504.1 5-(carboxyamino)imidazole ribonucleotide synthase [Sphingomonas canadensis]
MTPLPPGSTIGILGSGQLGRMLGVAAAQLGYRIHVFAPEPGPACDIASAFTHAPYTDTAALIALADACGVVTYEFENVPVEPLRAIAAKVRPGLRALEVAQARVDEKRFVRALGGRTAPFAAAGSPAELAAALAEVGLPAIVKTNRMGYDGKGQARVPAGAAPDAAAVWKAIGAQPAIAEGFVNFAGEFSLILARGADGRTASYPAVANVHEGGILRTSTAPAALSPATAEAARALAIEVADALDYVGVLAIEFFDTAEGPVFNEMAPRVHNSGHWTIEGAETSQFENHVRAICGLPLGPATLTGARVTMENLIGADADRWHDILADPGAHLHLYGKHEARPGRKMGHVTRVTR